MTINRLDGLKCFDVYQICESLGLTTQEAILCREFLLIENRWTNTRGQSFKDRLNEKGVSLIKSKFDS